MKKILAIRFSGLGDIVMLLATLQKLKAKEPCRIILLCDCANAGVAKLSCGLIDEVFCIDRSLFRAKSFKAFKEIVRLFRFLQSQTFDEVIDFQNFGETATISFFAKAKQKRGAPKKPKYHFGYTHIVPRDERGHRSQFFHSIAGVEDSLVYPKLCLNKEAKDYAKRLVSKLDVTKTTIGLNIGSTQESRRWSEKRFLELGQRLKSRANVLVFIGPKEKRFAPLFEEFVVVQNTSISQLAGALSLCDLLVTNDTGPAHIAAALGVKTCTLFSTGTDENVGALTRNKTFIRKNPINSIEVEEVLSILQKTLLSKNIYTINEK